MFFVCFGDHERGRPPSGSTTKKYSSFKAYYPYDEVNLVGRFFQYRDQQFMYLIPLHLIIIICFFFTDHDAFPHSGSSKVTDNFVDYNDKEFDYETKRSIYFFPDETLGDFGRVVALRFRPLTFIDDFAVAFFTNNGGNFTYQEAVEVRNVSCLSTICYFRFPDDVHVHVNSDTFYALHYRKTQVVGNSDTSLFETTHAYRASLSGNDASSIRSSYRNNPFNKNTLDDLGVQTLPGIVFYITDFEFGSKYYFLLRFSFNKCYLFQQTHDIFQTLPH